MAHLTQQFDLFSAKELEISQGRRKDRDRCEKEKELYSNYNESKRLWNWVGFYLLREVKMTPDIDNSTHAFTSSSNTIPVPPLLVLSSFNGSPAVSLIRIGAGVCGTAIQQNSTQLVPNVHLVPNHIACDSRSQSEIVIPLRWIEHAIGSECVNENKDNKDDDGWCSKFIGLLDIDSPHIGAFDSVDREGLEKLAELYISAATKNLQCLPPVLLTREQYEGTEFAQCSLSNSSSKH